MFKRFQNFRLKLQIGAIAAIGILAIVLVAVVYEAGVMRGTGLREARQAMGSDYVAGKSAKEAVLAARRAQQGFMLNRTEDEVGQFAEAVTLAKGALDRISERSFSGSMLARTLKGVTSYHKAFNAYVDVARRVGLDETEGQLGGLRASVHELEKVLHDIDDPDLEILMLSMRRHEKDFLARGDSAYVGRFDEQLVKFQDLLEIALDRSDLKQAAARHMAEYDRAFKAATASVAEQNLLASLMNDSFAEVMPLLTQLEEVHLAAYGKVEAAEEANTENTWYVMVAAFVVAVVGMALAAWRISRAVSMPVERLTQTMTELADNRLDTEIPYADRQNELGAMARAVEVFRDNMRDADRLTAERQTEEAAKARRVARLEELTGRFDTAVGSLLENVGSAATQLQATAESMTSTAQTTTQQATTVSSAAEETSMNVESVASAAEELNASISEISRQVAESASVAEAAVREAERTNVTVESLAQASQKIVEVSGLINDIASQTSLLALNATIEAARAGEAGKGFAVVASEVKSLANQTAQATEEIGSQISAIQESTNSAVEAIRGIGKTIREVSEIASAIAAAVEEQGAATGEISRGAQQAALGTRDVSSTIGGVTQSADMTGAAAGQVLDAAHLLARQSRELRGEVETFLNGIKAA